MTIATNLKKAVEEAVTPTFHFDFRERFWFDDKHAQAFFHEIAEAMVILNPDGTLQRPLEQAIMALSPAYLIQSVQEETQEVLMGVYMSEGSPIPSF